MADSAPDDRRDADERFMRLAIDLAQEGEGSVEPNPMVGCVLVRDGAIIGQGFHQRHGGPHAEIEAIRAVGAHATKGATAYVSLEPCCHHGKTPPCSDALIEAGVKRVVVALTDPFPEVSGGGLQQLRSHGIEVTTGLLEQDAATLCAPYLKRVRTGKPWVIAKWAMTIDGRIATVSGESQWITGEQARADVHELRGRVDAIAVGMGTVEADDPMLTARLRDQSVSPKRIASRVVFCRHRLPALESRLVSTAKEMPLTIVAGAKVDASQLARIHSLGAEVIAVDTDDATEMVSRALVRLGDSEATNVMLEGGSELLASFSDAGQIDECHVYLGPRSFGGQSAPGPIGGLGIASLNETPTYRVVDVCQFKDDIKVVYRRA